MFKCLFDWLWNYGEVDYDIEVIFFYTELILI